MGSKQPSANALITILTAPIRLYQQGMQHLPLTPAERAALKLINGFLLAGAAGGVDAVAQYITSSNFSAIDWRTVLNIFLAVGGSGVLYAAQKWASARGDFALGALLSQAAEKVEHPEQPAKPLDTTTVLQAVGEVAQEVNDVIEEPATPLIQEPPHVNQ